MNFDFPLIPLLPLPITLVPASTFAALEHNQNQIQQAFASSVSIGIPSKNSTGPYLNQERLGAIVDALGQASAKAQELPTSITQTVRLAKNPTQRVYILRTGLDSGEDQWLDQLEIGSPLMTESIRRSLYDFHGSSNSITDSPQEDASKKSTLSRSEERGVYVAGMLKMGEKKLFIVDKFGTMHEQVVCCVLDFYVDASCQRRGFGKLLFDYMLKVEDIEPTQIAYDRPSPKLFRFLSKHFQLQRHLPQPNMFAIFEGFKLEDCNDTIQVDDNDFILGSISSPTDNSNSNFNHNTSVNTHHTTNNSSNPTTNKTGPFVSRALQSSVVFNSDHHHNTTSDQQPSKRTSSAFSSSISLASPVLGAANVQNGVGTGGSVSIVTSSNGSSRNNNSNNTATVTSPQSPNMTRSQLGGNSSGGTGKMSRLLASSIVFADPAVSSYN
ncbi:Alpha-tubulin N-acetyltransferase 1 [Lobosporangium transversale]|nr:Alpha-tubulin N-acetyltransferase 1 [Lobosporangium transversale]